MKTLFYTVLLCLMTTYNILADHNFKTRPESTPQVIFKNGTPLIAIRNVTENLIYLLNEKGELLTQPFFGTTNFSIATFQNKTCLIVGSSEGVIYNYHILNELLQIDFLIIQIY